MSLKTDPEVPEKSLINSPAETFNGRLRDELLNGWQFDSLLEAQVLTEDWRHDYNTNRPHSALNQQTPDQFHQTWNLKHQPQHANWT